VVLSDGFLVDNGESGFWLFVSFLFTAASVSATNASLGVVADGSLWWLWCLCVCTVFVLFLICFDLRARKEKVSCPSETTFLGVQLTPLMSLISF
jgi:hypothetical protein